MANRSTTLLQNALAGTARARTPQDAAGAVLAACLERTQVPTGRVYLLELRTAEFRPYVSIPSDATEHGRAVRADGIAIPSSRISTLEHFLEAAWPLRGLGPGELPGVVVYAFREGTCLGAIRLDGVDLASLDEDLRHDLVASSDLLVSIYEDRFAYDLLGAIQEPIDFSQSDDEFFREIALLIAESSGMEFVALREHDGNRLRSIALWGFDEWSHLPREAWDLEPISAFPPFERALTGRAQPVADIAAPELEELRARPWTRDIRSFVATPVRVGNSTFGVLSVGARCRFGYAELELRGFESIANGVGVSIANFRKSREISAQNSEYTEYAVAITGMEVARAARHEALGHIDNCFLGLRALRRVERLAGKQAPDIAKEFHELEGDLAQLSQTLDKIKFATKTPSAEPAIVLLHDLWRQARNAVAGRLQEERIDVHWEGPKDLVVRGLPDWLRQVFLNLLLNSVDAFRESSSRKGGRRIDLHAARPADKANEITLTYRDNAGGINPQRLRIPPKYAHEPLQQQIFEPEVTSKSDGSGFGLWLVRGILADHGGSIDLTNHRQGVTFVIRLPKLHQATLGDRNR